ncbi:MAG: phosphate ABC transporter permease PstA [Candidatus Auribacterota bacterium]
MSRETTTDTQNKTTFKRSSRQRAKASLFAQGEPMIWLTGGGLVVSLMMIAGLMTLIVINGINTLWPKPVDLFVTYDNKPYMGEITRVEHFNPAKSELHQHQEKFNSDAVAYFEKHNGIAKRMLVRTGNFDLSGEHYNWVNEYDVREHTTPMQACVVERTSWGRFYGFPSAFLYNGEVIAQDDKQIWETFNKHHKEVRKRWRTQRKLETHEIGKINFYEEKERLKLREKELKLGIESEQWNKQNDHFKSFHARSQSAYEDIRTEINSLKEENDKYKIRFTTADNKEKIIPLADIVRMYPANSLTFFDRMNIYLSRWHEFLFDEPREANSEGGVFPAIFGTVVMTVIMSLAVVPFGVMAALYLREYAKGGLVVSTIRISINNLAGVPSIVFGVFGLGFFCYMVGASIDDIFFAARLPNPTFGKGGILWASMTLALMTLPVVIVATEEALSAVPNSMREGSYACGAGKWQTIWRIVLPRAMPGIMTGMILAMARGAGEVAPLMLVGAVKLAPELPVDGMFPFVHLERSFMHLGFHIYDLGFQSQNSEAAKPMVFTTTLLLITIVFVLNMLAVKLRRKLRKKFVSAKF